MIESFLSKVIGAVRFWVVLLLMAPVAYYVGNQVYEAGDGWIKILGQEGFSKKVVAVIGLAIGLPIATLFGSQIQSFLYSKLPSGIWLLSFIGIGLLGILWMVNDAANLNLRDGRTSTQILIAGSVFLIITPFVIQHITSTYNLGQLWRTVVIQPIMQKIVTPLIANIYLILLGAVVCLYGYYQYRTD
jgi:hypothetical protein